MTLATVRYFFGRHAGFVDSDDDPTEPSSDDDDGDSHESDGDSSVRRHSMDVQQGLGQWENEANRSGPSRLGLDESFERDLNALGLTADEGNVVLSNKRAGLDLAEPSSKRAKILHIEEDLDLNLGLHGSQLGSQSSDEDGSIFGVSAGLNTEPQESHTFVSDGHLINPAGTAAGKSTLSETSNGTVLGKRVLHGEGSVVDKIFEANKKQCLKQDPFYSDQDPFLTLNNFNSAGNLPDRVVENPPGNSSGQNSRHDFGSNKALDKRVLGMEESSMGNATKKQRSMESDFLFPNPDASLTLSDFQNLGNPPDRREV